MPYATIWIEGEKALDAFCMKRFGAKPHFVETIGRCGAATIYMVYMEHPNGGVNDIMSVTGESYEVIMKKTNTIKKDDKWIKKYSSNT